MSAAPSLTVQLAIERRRLDDLVRSGGDTAECRGRIARLEGDVARETATNETNVARRTRERDNLSHQADQIASDRLKEIRAAVAPFSAPPRPDDEVDAAVQRDHHEAVGAFLQAEEALRSAASRLDITSTESTSLAQRAQALEQRKEAMKHRRARGDTGPILFGWPPADVMAA